MNDLAQFKLSKAGHQESVDADAVDAVTNIHVMQACWSAYAEGDLQTVLSWYADDAIWALNLPREIVPFGGENRGKAAIADALSALDAQFETVLFQPIVVTENEGVVRCSIKFCFRHRLTGLVHEGTSTHRCIVRDNLVRRVDAVCDVLGTTAFMGIVSARAAQLSEHVLRS